jgi:hypothetical protein
MRIWIWIAGLQVLPLQFCNRNFSSIFWNGVMGALGTQAGGWKISQDGTRCRSWVQRSTLLVQVDIFRVRDTCRTKLRDGSGRPRSQAMLRAWNVTVHCNPRWGQVKCRWSPTAQQNRWSRFTEWTRDLNNWNVGPVIDDLKRVSRG